MAKMIKWVDRVGEEQLIETKEGQVYIATINQVVKVNGRNKIAVEIDGRVFDKDDEWISVDVWKKGVLQKIINKIKQNCFVGKTQVINGVLFTIIEYAKNKFTAVAEGFEGTVKRGIKSWHNSSFYETAIRRKEIVKKVVTTTQEKVKKILLLPAPKEIDYIEILRTTYKLKELKNAYRNVSKKFHPDNLLTGDVQIFKLADSIYKTRKKVIEDTIETFGENDKDFKEIVDMFEEAAKEMNGINY